MCRSGNSINFHAIVKTLTKKVESYSQAPGWGWGVGWGGVGGKLFNSHRWQAKSVPAKERAVPGKDLRVERVRQEDMTTEDDDECQDVVVHMRRRPKKKR